MIFSKQTVWQSILGRNYIGNSHISVREGRSSHFLNGIGDCGTGNPSTTIVCVKILWLRHIFP